MPQPPDTTRSDGHDPVCTRTISSSIVTRCDGDHVVVRIDGELCFDDAELLEHTLRAALDKPVSRLDLDLGDLTFWDCSALNVLLTLRRQALAVGKTIAVTAASPVAERLLTLTDTRGLFTPAQKATDADPDEDTADTADGADTEDGAGGADSTDGEHGVATDDGDGDGLRSEVVQLRRALQTRPEIDMARGILMASFGLSADEAWDVLVMASQGTNTKLHRLASNVVTAVTGGTLPQPVRQQLTAAVARRRAADARSARGSAPPRAPRRAGSRRGRPAQ
ncbi:ANTAR domain-containing protein [Streptomyces sp. NPDC004629]|uniref:ANTAR domain-containing protein n=1 Tax=Streptomyces sp. NPDC004629 TaxID=3364705 RepID=UPI0036B5660C